MVNLEAPHFSTAAPPGATRRTFHPPFTRGTVRVTARELDSSLIEIVISDTGPGLEPSELDQVRDFLPGKTSKKYVGTGFGLPIARRNLRAHGGSIQIDSAPEEGTRVTMLLPQDPREEVAA